MSDKKKKIDPDFIGTRTRIPLVTGCVTWLMLDRLEASGVVCGAVWALFGVIVVVFFLAPHWEEHVHPGEFSKPKGTP